MSLPTYKDLLAGNYKIGDVIPVESVQGYFVYTGIENPNLTITTLVDGEEVRSPIKFY